MKYKSNTIGNFLKAQRQAKKLTQKQLADIFNLTCTQFVSNWERGICLPPANYLPKLCQVLNIERKTLINLILEKTEADLDAHFKTTATKEKKNGTK
jgi:transcriptional regulator with XRE-family HTH domain